MKIDIISFIGNENGLLDKVINIRLKVFTDEQKIEKNIVFDCLYYKLDKHLVIVDDVPAAKLRYNETKDVLKIERMAVLNQYRILSIGTSLIKFVLNQFKNYKKYIYINAQQSVIEFYKKLNFLVVGEKFVEAKIPHYKMIYKK